MCQSDLASRKCGCKGLGFEKKKDLKGSVSCYNDITHTQTHPVSQICLCWTLSSRERERGETNGKYNENFDLAQSGSNYRRGKQLMS